MDCNNCKQTKDLIAADNKLTKWLYIHATANINKISQIISIPFVRDGFYAHTELVDVVAVIRAGVVGYGENVDVVTGYRLTENLPAKVHLWWVHHRLPLHQLTLQPIWRPARKLFSTPVTPRNKTKQKVNLWWLTALADPTLISLYAINSLVNHTIIHTLGMRNRSRSIHTCRAV